MQSVTTMVGARQANAYSRPRRERDDGNARAFRARRAAVTKNYRTTRAALRAGVEV